VPSRWRPLGGGMWLEIAGRWDTDGKYMGTFMGH